MAGVDLAEVAFTQLLQRLAGFRGGAGIGMGIVFAGVYRALTRHLSAAGKLLEAQGRYEKAKQVCNRTDFHTQAWFEYESRK
jgi:hypothetical protein